MGAATPLVTQAAVSAGGSMGSAALVSSGASVLSTSALTSIATPSLFTTAASMGGGMAGGGFFSSLGTAFRAASTAYETVKPYMTAVSVGTQLVGAYNSLRMGEYNNQMMKIQQMELENKKQVARLNAIKNANDLTRKYLTANSSVIANAYAGGVNAFDGSALFRQVKNADYYAKDLATNEYNKNVSSTFADANIAMLNVAREEAITGSKFEALSYVGNAAYMYEKTRTS